MHQIISHQGVHRASSPQHHYPSPFFPRDRNLNLDLEKSRVLNSPFGEGISPYPSPPMSEATPPHDRSPTRQQPPRPLQGDPRRPPVLHQQGFDMPAYREGRLQAQEPYPRPYYSNTSAPPPPMLHAPQPLPAVALPSAHTQNHTSRSPFLPPTQQTQGSRPPVAKRVKSHVSAACTNCKKAHLACDVERPCNRCVSLGKQDTCKDVPHKKRGRPRLKEDRGHSFEVNTISNGAYRPHPHAGSSMMSPGISPTMRQPPSAQFPPSSFSFSYGPTTPREEIPRTPRFPEPYPQQSPHHEHLQRTPVHLSAPLPPRSIGIFTNYLHLVHCSDELFKKFGLDTETRTDLTRLCATDEGRNRLLAIQRSLYDEIQKMDPNFARTTENEIVHISRRKPFEVWMGPVQEFRREWVETVNLLYADGSVGPVRLIIRLMASNGSYFVVVELQPLLQQQQHRQSVYSMPAMSPALHPPTPTSAHSLSAPHRLSLPSERSLPPSPAAGSYALQNRHWAGPSFDHSPRLPPFSSPSVESRHSQLASQSVPPPPSLPPSQSTIRPHSQAADVPLSSIPRLSTTLNQDSQQRPLSAPELSNSNFRLPPLSEIGRAQKRARSERDEESGPQSGGSSPTEQPKKRGRIDVSEMINSS